MKKFIFAILMTAMALTASAQEERSEWLTSFDDVVVEGVMDIRFVQIASDEAPKVVYDTKGNYTTKFSATVKDRVLTVKERTDARRPEPTVVTVYYNAISSITATDAMVTFKSPLAQKTFDLTLTGQAEMTAQVDIKDIDAVMTGRSKLTLTGAATYLTLDIATGKFEGAELECAAVRVLAQSGAEAKVWAVDRLEGSTSTNGVIRYKGVPDLLRISRKFMAGDVKQLE